VRTGILGGTFDPIHIAHLHTAECALYQLNLDRVLIVPAGDPWQKAGRFISPAAVRIEMCHLALADVEEIEVDAREAVRDGPSFTIDTLDTFPADEELFLILGADAAAGLPTWERWRDVVERVTVVVAPRPGARALPDDIPRLKHVEMGLLEVSGTEIRQRVHTGRPYRYLVTEPVHEYIESHGLYAQPAEADMVKGLNSREDLP
jgi:nicotinate-nucleotide adenylyltransferase